MAKDQTEMAFMENADETVDPVSGNDVPPGSLPEEVRDDIDAKLSEGEYVVPADVVRYYGVKFFENLRTKAKQGLQQMDEDGRIGGEPTLEMSLPFDISELEVEDDDGVRIAVGGLVAEYNVGGYTGVGSSFGGYGGYTGYKPYDPTVQPVTTTPTPVATTTAAPTTVLAGPKIETYYRPDGTPVPITFINGKPQQSTQGLTKKNPNSMDTKETYNPLEGAKLNEFGQPVDAYNKVIDPSEYGKFPFGTIDALFGTSARKERQLADYKKAVGGGNAAEELSNILNKNVEDSKPSLLKRIGQGVVAFGTAALTKSPTTGLVAGKALGEVGNSNNIANAKVALKVMEALYTGPGKINDSKLSMDYKAPIAGSQNEKLREAYLEGAKLISAAQGNDPSRFKLGVDFILSGSEQKKFDALVKAGLLEEMGTGIAQDALETRDSPTAKSAAQIAYDNRLNLAKTKWAGKPKGNPSWNQTGPTEETYEKYVNVGRASEKITAKGQVMRTQADAYNQNRADDQSAASERAGRRAAARNAATSGNGYTDKNGVTHRNGQAAVDAFNRDNADDIRTKYGGNKQTDSNGEDSGGTHCCTAAQARGDMTITEVKKLRAWHREQDMFWQEGYDVWGKVIADNLVAKSKWQSDRVRDFYDHKIYGKRTIGSIYADVVIYPMSYIIGAYKVLKNTLKIKGTNYGN